MSRAPLLAILLLLLPGGPCAAEAVVRFGSVAVESPASMHHRVAPLVDYLRRATGLPIELHLSPNISETIRALARGEIDLAYLTPAAYVKVRRLRPIRPLVKAMNHEGGTFRLALIARRGSGIETPADLAGLRFAFGDRQALLQRAVVQEAGLALERFGHHEFLNHRDNVLRAVLLGHFDGGVVAESVARAWRERGIAIIHTSRPLPTFNISASDRLAPVLARRIEEALLSLDPSDLDDRATIKSLDPDYTGFAPVSDGEYDVVRSLIATFEDSTPESLPKR